MEGERLEAGRAVKRLVQEGARGLDSGNRDGVEREWI